MDKKEFDITLLGNDINILSDDLQYSTIGKGFGLQSNLPEVSSDYSRLYMLCNRVHREIQQISENSKKYSKNDTGRNKNEG